MKVGLQFENTTHITEAGYRAILCLKYRRQQTAYHVCSLVLAAPFLGRFLYALVMSLMGQPEQVEMRWTDVLFACLILIAVWVWQIPNRQIQQRISRSYSQLDLDAVNQYIFFPDHIQMLSTSSTEKFELDYDSLTWLKTYSKWIILFFADRNFTMLVDRTGFHGETAEACLSFLRKKLADHER